MAPPESAPCSVFPRLVQPAVSRSAAAAIPIAVALIFWSPSMTISSGTEAIPVSVAQHLGWSVSELRQLRPVPQTKKPDGVSPGPSRFADRASALALAFVAAAHVAARGGTDGAAHDCAGRGGATCDGPGRRADA